jgi:hypothetical protein
LEFSRVAKKGMDGVVHSLECVVTSASDRYVTGLLAWPGGKTNIPSLPVVQFFNQLYDLSGDGLYPVDLKYAL